jgi:enamine deaminase RidA (YjgF/YER057c/UK114 family)
MKPSTPQPNTQPGEDINAAELAAGLTPTPGYRYADRVGDQLFVAGQVPLDSDGDLVSRDDPAAQAHACLDNLRTLLDVHDFGLGDVRHLTIYVVGEHQHLLDAWRAVTEWFAAPVPPATLLGVNMLGHRDQLVEIDATIRRLPTHRPRDADETQDVEAQW